MATPTIDYLLPDNLVMHDHSASDLGAILDSRYVNISGDTMTGALVVNTGTTGQSTFSEADAFLGSIVLYGASGTGSVTGATVYKAQGLSIDVGNAVTVGVYKGFYATNLGHAKITSSYAIYLDAQSGSATDNYSIYSAGGTMYHAGNVCMGANTVYGGAILNVTRNVTATSGSDNKGMHLYTNLTPTADSSATVYALYVQANADATSYNLTGGVYGSYYQVYTSGSNNVSTTVAFNALAEHYGGGTASYVRGMQGIVFTRSGGGALTNAHCFYAYYGNQSAAITSSAVGFYVDSFANTGGGSITNAYGVYIGSQTAATNNYAILTNAGNVVFNEGGDASTDFRVESDSYDALFIDASDNATYVMNHASGKVSFFGATPVTKQTELTDELTTITFTAPGTPDYAVQDLTNIGGYGFVTKDEGNSVLSVIANLQARVNELETKLTAYGLLIDAD